MMNNEVSHPVAKASTALAAAGFAGMTLNEWSLVATIIAAGLAGLYSLILIADWFWKRALYPMALTRGWIKPKNVWAPDLD